jgi:molybdate transport system substrate-binding protein
MTTLNIFCAGAAQAVVSQMAAKFQRESGNLIHAEYGAVGAMKARVTSGAPVDIVILTAALVDELIAEGEVVPGSRVDLGKVGTGVAVRAGTPRPDVRNVDVLRGNILAATRIVCPDPAVATAGKVVLRVLDQLGVAAEVTPRLQYFPNGYAAMGNLAQSDGLLEMGITQVTEILANPGVTLVGPLPDAVQNMAVYAAGLAVRAGHPERSREFIRRLTGFSAQPMLSAAGFVVGG